MIGIYIHTVCKTYIDIINVFVGMFILIYQRGKPQGFIFEQFEENLWHIPLQQCWSPCVGPGWEDMSYWVGCELGREVVEHGLALSAGLWWQAVGHKMVLWKGRGGHYTCKWSRRQLVQQRPAELECEDALLAENTEPGWHRSDWRCFQVSTSFFWGDMKCGGFILQPSSCKFKNITKNESISIGWFLVQLALDPEHERFGPQLW